MYLLVVLTCSFNLSNLPVIKMQDSKCMSSIAEIYEDRESCSKVQKELKNVYKSGSVAHCLKYSGKDLKIKFVK